jgi:hypothetical protein
MILALVIIAIFALWLIAAFWGNNEWKPGDPGDNDDFP